jgi:hypothetical protein
LPDERCDDFRLKISDFRLLRICHESEI